MLIKANNFRKTNAILEYGVVLVIVLGAMAGINAFLKRNIQRRVHDESDAWLGHGQGLEWEMSITHSDSSSNVNRDENMGANFDINAQTSSSSVTYSPPMPPYIMEHKGSALHIQDAPSAAPLPDYPDLEYKDWEDREWTDK
ncbi:MAG: hypothetical protein K9L86_00190 [Candidatus Omnitrophica bacterium]|nr:hypothetical protein [Candidatus Omnitrophota bacterium]